jgi:mRNA-degrading endonuclease toxin of MazEF toxin-antitoxin module
MIVKRGDVVLVPISFSSGVSGKIRPALVVQSDHNNARLMHTIVAAITTTTHRASTEATQLLIDITTPDGKQSGLIHSSAVKCGLASTLTPWLEENLPQMKGMNRT